MVPDVVPGSRRSPHAPRSATHASMQGPSLSAEMRVAHRADYEGVRVR